MTRIKNKTEEEEQPECDYRMIAPPAMSEERSLFIRRRDQDRCPTCGVQLYWGIGLPTEDPRGQVDKRVGYCNACKLTWFMYDLNPVHQYKQWYKPRELKQAKLFDERMAACQCPKCGIQLFDSDGRSENDQDEILRDNGDACKEAGYCHQCKVCWDISDRDASSKREFPWIPER